MDDAQFIRRTLIVFAVAAGIVLAWVLGRLLLLAFGAIVIALVIRGAGEVIAGYTRLSARWASVVVVAFTALVLVALGMFVGEEVADQLSELQRRLPEAFASAREWLVRHELGRMILPRLDEAASGGGNGAGAAEGAVKTVTVTLTAASHIVLVILIAVYLAFNPGMYVAGAIALAPPRHRAQVAEALAISAKALRRWLVGQFAAMLAVGILTGVGLWIAGVPLPFALGLVAGLLEFVPVAGPFIAAIPGLVLAFTVSPMTAVYALLVYVIVQQLESGVITPLAQRWAVHLPPALGLFSIVVFALLFGIPGILFATPLTVVLMVLVQRFYVSDAR